MVCRDEVLTELVWFVNRATVVSIHQMLTERMWCVTTGVNRVYVCKITGCEQSTCGVRLPGVNSECGVRLPGVKRVSVVCDFQVLTQLVWYATTGCKESECGV